MDQVNAEFVSRFIALTDDEKDVYLDALDADQKELVEQLLLEAAEDHESAGWRANPATMAHHLTGGRIKMWRYTLLLAEKFRQAVRGESTRQIWNMPPRFGKSMWASQWGPAWALDDNPRIKLILVSYGDTLAYENAVAVRKILRDHRSVLRAQLQPDRQEKRRFLTTQGGGILAAPAGGVITGFGGHGIVYDDPHKGWPEAHSAANRDLVDHQFKSVVGTRLEDESSFMIVPMTRWHGDDLSGRLLQRMEDGTGASWDLVRIPDFAEAWDPESLDPLLRIPDPLGRDPGEPIEPERFSVEATKTRHLLAGTYLTAGMYQQRPAPEEGGEIKRVWWRVEDTVPTVFDDCLSSWDMKLKDKESGDFVVGQVWGRTGKDCWLVDQLRGQWNQATTENAIALMSVRHPEAQRHIVENTGNGPEVMTALRAPMTGYTLSDDIAGQLGMTAGERAAVQAVRRRGIGKIIPNNVKGDKSVRMRAVSGHIEGGDVHLPAHAQFLGVFLDETAAFPNGSYDDQVDACSQALSRLLKQPSTVRSAASATLPKVPTSTRGPQQAMAAGRRGLGGVGGVSLGKPPSRLR